MDALLPAACRQGVVGGVLRAEVLDGLASPEWLKEEASAS
jgi:hypothetical protein